MKYICWLIYKKRFLESSEMPVLYRGSAVPKGWYTLIYSFVAHYPNNAKTRIYICSPTSDGVPLENCFLWNPAVNFQNTAHLSADNVHSTRVPICDLDTHTLVQPWWKLLHRCANGRRMQNIRSVVELLRRNPHWLTPKISSTFGVNYESRMLNKIMHVCMVTFLKVTDKTIQVSHTFVFQVHLI
jgi:hypothetical protein